MLISYAKSSKRISSIQHLYQRGCLYSKTIDSHSTNANFSSTEHTNASTNNHKTTSWCQFFEKIRADAKIAITILNKDRPGFDLKSELDNRHIRASHALLKEVFSRLLYFLNPLNKVRIAKTAFRFFLWSREQPYYHQTSCSYNLLMRIFAKAGELNAVWRTLDEMTEKGFSITALTFNILICTCEEAGLAKDLVERFIKSKTFNYRRFKHSYNAILHSLIVLGHFVLIEWVYEQMIKDGESPDVLTYNILLRAKYMLGKSEEFFNLLDDMKNGGFFPDFYTYGVLLHVLGRKNKPLAALNLLNQMREIGINPSTLHFTTLVDGLSRRGNLEACEYFFEEMVKQGCAPDVVCYTVMINCYVVGEDMGRALVLLGEMIVRGEVPNVFTYGSLIRGFCVVGKFEEACSMLDEMQRKGCTPNFVVCSTLFRYLVSAGLSSKAHEILSQMTEKGKYVNMVSRLKKHVLN